MAEQWAELEDSVGRMQVSSTLTADLEEMAATIRQLETENARLRQRLAEAEMTLALHGLAVRGGAGRGYARTPLRRAPASAWTWPWLSARAPTRRSHQVVGWTRDARRTREKRMQT